MNAAGLVPAAGCRCVSGIELCIVELILIWSCDDLHSLCRLEAILTDYDGEPRWRTCASIDFTTVMAMARLIVRKMLSLTTFKQ